MRAGMLELAFYGAAVLTVCVHAGASCADGSCKARATPPKDQVLLQVSAPKLAARAKVNSTSNFTSKATSHAQETLPRTLEETPLEPSSDANITKCDMSLEENKMREALCEASESTTSGRSPTWNSETCSCNCDKDAESQCKNHIVNGIWHPDECYCSTPTNCADGWARMACLNEDADGSGIAYWNEAQCRCARCPKTKDGKQMAWDKKKGKCSDSVCPEGQRPYFGSCACDQEHEGMRKAIHKCIWIDRKRFDWYSCTCQA